MSGNRLTVVLGCEHSQLIQGFQQSSQAAEGFNGTVTRTAGKTRNSAAAFLELARGVEDAAVGFSTNGLRGAIMGAGNNLTAFAAMLSPAAGAIAGVALAATTLLIPALMGSGKAARDFRSEIDDLKQSFDSLLDFSQNRINFGFDLSKAGTSDALQGMQDQLTREQALNADKLATWERQRQALRGKAFDLPGIGMKFDGTNRLGLKFYKDSAGTSYSANDLPRARPFMGSSGSGQLTDAERTLLEGVSADAKTAADEITDLDRKIRELQERQQQIASQSGEVQAKLASVTKREAQALQSEQTEAASKAAADALAKMRGEAAALGKSLRDELDPAGAKSRAILESRDRRLSDIARYRDLGALSATQAAAFMQQTRGTAAAQLAALVSSTSVSSVIGQRQGQGPASPAGRPAPIAAPELLRKGSAEAYRAIAQAQARGNAGKAKQEALLQDQLALQKERAQRDEQWQRAMLRTKSDSTEVIPP